MSDQPEPPVVPRVSVDWYRSLVWWYPIVRTLPLSWRATWLIPALLGVLALQSGQSISQTLFPVMSVTLTEELRNGARISPPTTPKWPGEGEYVSGSYLDVWRNFFAPLELFTSIPNGSPVVHINQAAQASFAFLWSLATWSIFGTWIIRRSVVELGTRSTEGWGKTAKVVRGRWFSVMMAVCGPILAVSLFLTLPAMAGLIARLGNIGLMIAGVCMILLVPTIFPIGRLLLSSVLGFPLAFAAVATEKRADGYEGLSRSIAYGSQAPVQLVLISIALQLISMLGLQIIKFVYIAGSGLIFQAFALGSGATSLPSGADAPAAWIPVVEQLPQFISSAFAYSFFFTGSAAMYLTLRQNVDQTDIDEMDMLENGEPKPLPEIAAPPAAKSTAEKGASSTETGS